MAGPVDPASPPEKSEAEILHMTEIFLVALCLFREARSQGPDGMQFVYDVIANRAADPRWPNSRMSVVLQPKQFSCYNPNDSQAVVMPKMKDVGDWLAWIQACRIVERGMVRTPSINHYHTRAVTPTWSRGKPVAVEHKDHLFYTL